MRIFQRLGRGVKSAAAASYVILTNGVDVALLSAANLGRNATDIVLSTQHLDATGAPLMSLSSHLRAGFVRLSNGTIEALLSPADTPRNVDDVVLSTQPLDSQGNVITGGGGTSGGLTLYSNPYHFTVTRFSDTQLDLAGSVVALISLFHQFVEIDAYSAAGAYEGTYKPKSHDFSWDAVNNRVTVAGVVFAAGGSWDVKVLAADRTINLPGDFANVAEVSHFQLTTDDGATDLITAAQNFTDAFVDAGEEIDLYGKSGLTLFFTLDINDDSNLRFRVLGKHESAGVEEYLLSIKTVGTAVVDVDGLYYEFTNDSDQLACIRVETNGEIPIGQVQIQRGTNGAGVAAQVDALSYIRGAF